jgi:hypothetical protein
MARAKIRRLPITVELTKLAALISRPTGKSSAV